MNYDLSVAPSTSSTERDGVALRVATGRFTYSVRRACRMLPMLLLLRATLHSFPLTDGSALAP